MSEEEYSVDCPYREQTKYGNDYCARFGMDDVDEDICGGCRVADMLQEDPDIDIEDLL